MVLDRDGNSSIYQITRDNIGSVLLYENANGTRYQYSYSPWGVRTYRVGNNSYLYQPGVELANGPFYRTYTGHEDLWMFGLLKVNARLYSPYLGRFISPDPLLNSEGGPLDYNPYIYARNNPYKYIDRNGEFWWLVAAIGAEALLGGATYSISAAISGNWNVGDFFKSMGVSAVSAGLSAGFGVLLGPSVGNQLSYGLLSSTSNYFITSAIYGEKISFAGIPGIVVGAAVNSSLPTFSPSGSNPFVNALSEITFNTVRGAITGFASGTINAMVHDDVSLIWKGAAGGAISGFARTAIHNKILGAPYQPLNDKNEPVSYGDEGLYRKGGIAGMLGIGYGLTLGKHVYTYEKELEPDKIKNLRFHENYHIQQINDMGLVKFYGTLLIEYMKYGFHGSYPQKGSLEFNANYHAWKKTGIRF